MKKITAYLLALTCSLTLASCGGGGGGGGTAEAPTGGNTTTGDTTTPGNNTTTTTTPSTKPTVVDHAPRILPRVKLANYSQTIYVGGSGSGASIDYANSSADLQGYWDYEKTGVNTAKLYLNDMKFTNLSSRYRQNYVLTMTWNSATSVSLSGTYTVSGSTTNTNGQKSFSFSGTISEL